MSVDLPSPVEYAVVRSARRRSLALTVDAEGRVEVRAPMQAGHAEIAAFVQRHARWVVRKRAEAAANPPWAPDWSAGGHWFWQGRLLRLAGGGPRGGELAGDELALPLTFAHGEAHWRRAVLAWHQREARTWLEPRLESLFSAHCEGHRLQAVHWRWMRVTWGTCRAPRGAGGGREVQIRLNYRLAALPPALADAVLLHEIAHVGHLNHGPGFYRRLAGLDPGWREHDRDLRIWGRRLLPVPGR